MFNLFKLIYTPINIFIILINKINLLLSTYFNLITEEIYKHKNVHNKYYNTYRLFFFKNLVFNFFKKNNFVFIDSIFFFLSSLKYLYKNKNFRYNQRLLNTKQGFYLNFNDYNYVFIYNLTFYGVKSIWMGVRYWIIPFLFIFIIIYSSLVLKLLPFNKIMFSWIGIIMLVYWLISGFIFFIKKYQFGKYTSVIQRFWRRSYILFWLIEGGTFIVFLFLTVNSSQESFYMFDQISVFKTHLYSWNYFFIKIFPIIILIIVTYLLIVSLKWNIYSKLSIILLLITFLLTYLVWLEFYQFYHVINFYSQVNWVYDIEEHIWSLEYEIRKTRTTNHYIMLLFILKFWHVVFIYGFWVFFVLRCWETKKIKYPLLSANFQNFIILYIFAWVFMYPWFKFFFRKFLDNTYYWFYINNKKVFFRVVFYDLKLIFYGVLYFLENFFFFKKFSIYNFFYFNYVNNSVNYESYKKHVIKDKITKFLVNKINV